MPPRARPGPATGRGEATFTADGCPVEMYAAMPPALEAARLVHAAVGAGASVLELGCGAGRISEPLVALGHRVTGVDSSAEMLARLALTRPVQATIDSLDLPDRYDAVLVASTLVNTVDLDERAQLIRAAWHHLRDGGVLVVECLPADWHPVDGQEWSEGPVRLTLQDVTFHETRVVSATVVHRLGPNTAYQDFSARLPTSVELTKVLERVGFASVQGIDAAGRWFRATRPLSPDSSTPR